MSDFDAVLERLLADPGFKAALSADPDRALAGYQLSADEVELLHAQLDIGGGGNRQVEQRTSKASLFGLLSPLAGAVGIGSPIDAGAAGGISGIGGDVQGLDTAVIGQGIRPGDAGSAGLGDLSQAAFGDGQTGFGDAGQAGFSDAGRAGFGGLAGEIGAPMGHVGEDGGLLGHNIGAVQDGVGGLGAAPPPPDYHPHIDVDGDGHWDKYTVVGRPDGGVDVVADMNHDGRADFIGHDYDRDGLIDKADYDEDRDGTFETHMADVDGDGWMDTRVVDHPQPQGGAAGSAGRHRLPEEEEEGLGSAS
jgi:hypothetical protein